MTVLTAILYNWGITAQGEIYSFYRIGVPVKCIDMEDRIPVEMSTGFDAEGRYVKVIFEDKSFDIVRNINREFYVNKTVKKVRSTSGTTVIED